MNETPQIAVATPSDYAAIVALLDDAQLPSADLAPDRLAHFSVAHSGARIIAAVGLEVHADVGLLRSLVVASEHVHRNLGKALVGAIETTARTRGVKSLTLLTTTAAPFFARLGYRRLDRDVSSAALQNTAEFARLCPASAICMIKTFPSA